MPELLAIPYSPWSEKASWALDVKGLSYDKRAYLPLVGEPELRLRLRRPFGRVSVPLWIDGRRVIEDSFEIARHADAQGQGPALFPAGSESSVADYNVQSERGLSAGRALALTRILDDREALIEQVPKKLGAVLGPLSLAVARAGVERTLRKYEADSVSLVDHRAELHAVLTTLRADLDRRPKQEARTLLSDFSYADIVMAQVLAFVRPVESRHFRVAPASRRNFTDTELSHEFHDLVVWRDALYARYRDL